MTEQIKYIPARLKSAVKGGHVTGSEDIDAGGGKTQQQVNNEAAQGAAALTQRVADLEAMEQIVIDGGEAQIATGSDFTNPDSTKRAKIPTVGAVLDGINDGVYDVSLRFPAGGPNSDGKFTLDYILSNANTYIPLSRRHGGMQISFVHSSDNKYVQARLMAQNFTTDVTQWQGVEDSGDFDFHNTFQRKQIPTVGSVIDMFGFNANSSEYIELTLDSERKILGGRKLDGTRFENLPFEIQGVKKEVLGNFKLIEATVDIGRKILSARDENGYLYENVGIITPLLKVGKFVFSDEDLAQFHEDAAIGNILYGKKWCVVGDSFSAWSPENYSDGKYAGNPITYKYIIALRNNMTIHDMSVSGRTMAYPNDHTFNNAFAKPSIYQAIPEDCDYITIMLGINDVSHILGESQDSESVDGDITIGTIDSTDTGTFYGAWNVVLDWIFTNRPNSHLGIIITNGLGGPTGEYGETSFLIYKAIKDIVHKWNVPSIDLNGGDGKTPMMQRGIYPEGTPTSLISAKWNAFATSPEPPYNGHTNVAGHRYESTFIENFLRTL